MIWRAGIAFAAFTIGFLLILAAAVSQERGHIGHPPQDMELHTKFYSTWMRPDHPTASCCNNQDCYPTEARFRNGHWEARRREDGKWLIIPDEKIERSRDMPDARAHLCAPIPQYEGAYKNGVICFGAGSGV